MNSYFKRYFDIFISCIILLLFISLFILIAIVIKIDNPGPILFRQKRVGKDSQIFIIYKFRTMVVNAESEGSGMIIEKDDLRITRFGKVLRYLSLDELPQLFNVIKGQMSLVGPRPTLFYQVKRYDQRQKRRLKVKPGMTGWAQINGRNDLTWPEKIDLDLWYIDNWSHMLDLNILFKTPLIVFRRTGIQSNKKYDDISKNPTEY